MSQLILPRVMNAIPAGRAGFFVPQICIPAFSPAITETGSSRFVRGFAMQLKVDFITSSPITSHDEDHIINAGKSVSLPRI
jgi:hypothetical protein